MTSSQAATRTVFTIGHSNLELEEFLSSLSRHGVQTACVVFRRIVEDCFRQEAGASTPLPNETADLIEAGILDSMAWVSFLHAVETASGVSGLGSGLND
jgi:hypothetical protein